MVTARQKERRNEFANRFSFLHSRSYYITLLVAAAGIQADYILTIQALSVGSYMETRPLFWLHFASLFILITLVFLVMYRIDRRIATYASLAIATVLPALPVVSNIMVLINGSSPFV